MLRLVALELRHGARAWVGTFILIALTAAIVATIVSQGESFGALDDQTTGVDGQAFATPLIALAILTAIIVSASTITLAVEHRRRSLALWKLAGLLPRQAFLLTFGQVLLTALVASCVGLAAAIPVSRPLLDFVASSYLGLPSVSFRFGVGTILTTILIILGTSAIAAIFGSWRASRIPPLDALRAPEPRLVRIGIFRWAIVGLLLLVVAGLVGASLGGASVLDALKRTTAPIEHLENVVVAATGVGFGAVIVGTALVAATAPLLMPGVLRAWTAFLPGTISPTWFIALQNARYRRSQIIATTTPLAVGVSLTSGIYTVFLTVDQALRLAGSGPPGSAGSGINTPSILTVLAGPLLIAAAGAAVSIVITSRSRAHDAALLMSAGGDRNRILIASLLEALTYAVSAMLVGFGVALLAGIAVSLSVGEIHPLTWPVVAILPGLLVGCLGFLLISFAIAPAVAATTKQRNLVSVLNTE